MACRRFLVSGRVQGVWYRQSTRDQAERLGLRGSAVNLPDGRVEVVACGAPAALAALSDWLWRGPVNARVTDVEAQDIADQDPVGFRTG